LSDPLPARVIAGDEARAFGSGQARHDPPSVSDETADDQIM
ncbi:MAG: spermidine synthase, partial [Gordonia polyisoprenivorans]|nr:spermidine synthase [Gordonia polyisoprenivorans]